MACLCLSSKWWTLFICCYVSSQLIDEWGNVVPKILLNVIDFWHYEWREGETVVPFHFHQESRHNDSVIGWGICFAEIKSIKSGNTMWWEFARWWVLVGWLLLYRITFGWLFRHLTRPVYFLQHGDLKLHIIETQNVYIYQLPGIVASKYSLSCIYLTHTPLGFYL